MAEKKQQGNGAQQDINQLLKVRREKLKDLQEAGKDPKAGFTKEERSACIRLLPGYMEADGFFIARFRRDR